MKLLECTTMSGRRVTRASDVVLATTAGAGLVLVGVEVGAAALLRRLGLAWLAPRRSHQIVAMDQLHLTSSRGHQVQLTAATSAMHRLDSTGLAHLLTRLDVTKATEVITAVGPDRAASALLKTHPEVGGRLMRALPVSESARIRARLGRDSTRTHPHLHAPDLARPRRSRRLAGWRTHHPPRAAA